MRGLPTRSASYTSAEVERSIAAGRRPSGTPGRLLDALAPAVAGRGTAVLGSLAVAGVLLVVYVLSHPERPNLYDHFVWQASAWLEGQAAIRYPVPATATSPGNAYFQDVMPLADANGLPMGRALIPFPPLPAVILLPFVAIWGLATNAQLIGAVIGALDVGLAWWIVGRLAVRPSTRFSAIVFLGLGTALWYAAAVGTTWFLAHVVAVGLTLLAIGVALGADPAAVAAGSGGNVAATTVRPDAPADLGERRETLLDPRGVLAGLLLGLAATARLTVVLGLPFLLLVGAGRGRLRRAASAAVGAALPVLGLLAYDLATTGHPFSPVYDYLYHLEALGYPELGYHPEWSIEDVRYIPQNLTLMLFRGPDVLPACNPPAIARGLFDAACPWFRPSPLGMSLLLTSPGYLLALPALSGLLRRRPSRLVVGAAVAVTAIAVVNLMHFSQGWVQFGYRFSLDLAPFALLLVALGLERLRRAERLAVDALVVVLLGASVAVNAWGIIWGSILGW